MEAWRSLIRRAVARLEVVGLGRNEWKWDGGTVLMLRYHHRHSRDALMAALLSPNCERRYLEIDRPALPIPFATARGALLDWIGATPPK